MSPGSMRATLMLCDHCVVAEGKLYISGGGWSITGPSPSPSGVAILVLVPWDQANETHNLQLALEHEDGAPVLVPHPSGTPQPLEIQAEFEIGRPPGVVRGTPLDMPMAINIPPQQLAPGRYRWVLQIDNERSDGWDLAFTVKSPEGPQQRGPASIPPPL